MAKIIGIFKNKLPRSYYCEEDPLVKYFSSEGNKLVFLDVDKFSENAPDGVVN